MYFTEQGNRLSARRQNETIWIEAWGKNALRVRATYNLGFTGHRGALSESAPGEVSEAATSASHGLVSDMASGAESAPASRQVPQIGRASCRERVSSPV